MSDSDQKGICTVIIAEANGIILSLCTEKEYRDSNFEIKASDIMPSISSFEYVKGYHRISIKVNLFCNRSSDAHKI